VWPKKAMRVIRSRPGLLVVMAGTAVLTVVAFWGPARRVELVDHSLMSRFLADQSALDRFPSTAQGLQQIEDENLAEGDGLSAGMQQHASAGLGALTGIDDATARALRAADGAIQNAGLKSGSGSLLGDLTGTQLASEMSDGGMPTARNNAHVGSSLKQELEASRKELADVVAGGDGAKFVNEDMGLSESALNSVADGMENGLDASQVDPTTGLATGQLALAPSKFAASLAKREMRHVAGGTMFEGGSLTGLVGADKAFFGADGKDGGTEEGSSAPPSAVHLKSDVQQRALIQLKAQLKQEEAMAARLPKPSPHAAAHKRAAAAMGKRAAKAHAAHRAMKKMASPSVKTGGGEAATEKRTVSLLKQQLKERQRQLRIMASAKAH
jgi:hypothetical protein